VTSLRSRRLESLFGSTLDKLTAEHIESLVDNRVAEEFDLDFKGSLYGRTDQDKRNLGGDVAALANTAGGVIILGVEEEGGHASAAPGVELSDEEASRIRQIVASVVAPMPSFDIVRVTQAGSTTLGYYVIAVPRSPSAPHAVLVNEGLRFPKRNGATTRYLSEPEVALAYRDRLAGEVQQRDRLDQIGAEATARINRDENPWVLVTLVPDLAGDLRITSAFVRDFREQTLNREAWTVTPRGVSFRKAQVGHRRLLADGSMSDSPRANWVSAEYHADGAGAYGLRVADLRERASVSLTTPDEPAEKNELLDDVMIAAAVLTGLIRLARHARDRAAAGGTALVRAQLLPSLDAAGIGIGHTRFHGFPETAGSIVSPDHVRHSDAAASLDDLADAGTELVRVAAALCDELGQVFGLAEQCQFTPDGEIRRRYWSGESQRQVVAWAERHAIPVSEEKLA